MGIASEENNDISRIRVLWFGAHQFEQDFGAFKRRRLSLFFVNGNTGDWIGHLNTSRGVIIEFDPKNPAAFKKRILAVVPTAIDYGVRVCIIVSDAISYEIARRIIADLTKNAKATFDDIKIFPSQELYIIAEEIARHKPGRYLDSSLKIKSNEDGLIDTISSSAQFLLQRAFSDCTSINVQKIPGGRVAKHVFSVHALYKGSLVGLRPLPFFAKIDKRHKIQREMDKYAEYADHYIPFNLRPNLVGSRCLLGFHDGIIVGNFVEQSETLLDSARRGHAQAPIYSLFDNALRGWKTQAEVAKGSIYKMMEIEKNGQIVPFVDLQKITNRALSFAKEFGARLHPQDLVKKLEELPKTSYQQAPIHGDLHSLNVRVRHHDAILIDFSSTRPGPLLADYASLEVSLAFEVIPLDKDFEGWLDLMDTVYSIQYINKTPPTVKDPHDREWLCSCIRQIRILALAEQKEQEYSSLLAIHLLRQATYPGETDEEKRRNAYAYVLAERLIKDISRKS